MAVYEELAIHPNINGVKEASGDIAKISRMIGAFGDDLNIWSGNDDQNVAITALGGKGAISVLSNICPKETRKMIEETLFGQLTEGAKLQNKMMPLIDALFCEVNPIPVKEALAMMGYDTSLLRLPLCGMKSENRENLRRIMKQYHLINA